MNSNPPPPDDIYDQLEEGELLLDDFIAFFLEREPVPSPSVVISTLINALGTLMVAEKVKEESVRKLADALVELYKKLMEKEKD